MSTEPSSAESPSVSFGQLARVFLLIGTIGFGGGMAVIALIEREVVRKRAWLELDEFLHGVALGQILGPFAANTATFIGYQLRGPVGALVAVVAFLAPSVALVTGLSAAYFHWHHIPALQSALDGLAPVVVALIFSAAVTMGRPKIKDLSSSAVAVLAIVVALATNVSVLVILSVAALYGVTRCRVSRGKSPEGNCA